MPLRRPLFARLARLDPLRLFLGLAPVLYLAFALLTPPFQTPDEHQHLFRAWQLADGQLISERRGGEQGGMVPAGLVAAATAELGSPALHIPRTAPRTTWAERFGRATPIADGRPVFASFTGAASYAPVAYLPQIAAIRLGRGLGLSVENIVRLGRAFAALAMVLLLWAAFRALPAGRLVLLVVALLPMTAACAGAFGQDWLVIGGLAWLTALGARAVAERRWTGGAAAAATLLTLAITLAKFVYLPLTGLGLILAGPGGRLRPGWPALVAAGLAAGGLVLWLGLNQGMTGALVAGYPAPAEQGAWLIAHPLAFPEILANTYDLSGSLGLLRGLFTFGWLNVGPARGALAAWGLAVLLALWAGDARAGRLPGPWRVWALAICAGVVAALSLALYLGASMLAATRVEGLQGRYFIPLLLPALLCLLPSRAVRPGWAVAGVVALLVVANLGVLLILARAWYA